MNSLLHLKGSFEQKSNEAKPGPSNLPRNKSLNIMHLERLIKELTALSRFWENEKILKGALVSVYYNSVVPKSRRISATFEFNGIKPNQTIVGAKFSKSDEVKHIITHYIDKEALSNTIKKYKICNEILKNKYNGEINSNDIERLNLTKEFDCEISRTNFIKIIIDAYYVEQFSLDRSDDYFENNSIITIYKTGIDTQKLMSKIGITLLAPRLIDDTTMFLTPDQFSILKQKAPYLIAMGVTDISRLTKSDFMELQQEDVITIPAPKNEPTIGVIDTLFDKNVYFSEWVEYRKMIDPNIPVSDEDYFHGTAVSSIIVDGVTCNPELDDGCGRFKVRHFGVAAKGSFSSFSILRAIKEIIASNRDIKVWNLSLGAVTEIHPSFISPEGAILDNIQYENDVIFVIAGTNKSSNIQRKMAIGSPADSINSLVVNAVNDKNEPASYSRSGPVLSFFTKPDVACFGGEGSRKIKVCTPTGEALVCGTSFAAPWISRKLSYLIDILGLSREVAKALILHSTLGWKPRSEESSLLVGYGVVPQHIEDIIRTQDDEIRFVLSGISEKYDTYTYNLPVPVYNEKHPFIAKATMCYFPACSRNQGVDYTDTEFDITFGRIKNKKIMSINKKLNNDGNFLYEGDARKLYRKWDNVKNLLEFHGNIKSRKAYEQGLWGISIKTFERLEEKHGVGIKFGLIITLKNLEGKNKIDDFIQQCQLKGWLVNKIDIKNKIDLYNIAEESITFDDI